MLTRQVTPLLSLGDVTSILSSSDPSLESAVWSRASRLWRAFPPRLRAAVEALASRRAHWILIDGEPERTDLPSTLDGLCRDGNEALMSDWFSLAYAVGLGAARFQNVAIDQVRLEWQLGDDALHADGLELSQPASAPNRWHPHTPMATYNSLKCLRVGSNPAIRTVLVPLSELVERRLSAGDIAELQRPQFRCPRISVGGVPVPFPILVSTRDEGWNVSPEALESSIFNLPRSASRHVTVEHEAARSALHAFHRARTDLGTYRTRVEWRPGTRLLLRQSGILHGRHGGVSPGRGDWDHERWLCRLNAIPTQRDPPYENEASRDTLRDAIAFASTARARANTFRERRDVLRALACFEW